MMETSQICFSAKQNSQIFLLPDCTLFYLRSGDHFEYFQMPQIPQKTNFCAKSYSIFKIQTRNYFQHQKILRIFGDLPWWVYKNFIEFQCINKRKNIVQQPHRKPRFLLCNIFRTYVPYLFILFNRILISKNSESLQTPSLMSLVYLLSFISLNFDVPVER